MFPFWKIKVQTCYRGFQRVGLEIYIYIIYSYITKYEQKPAAKECEHLFFKKHLIRR